MPMRGVQQLFDCAVPQVGEEGPNKRKVWIIARQHPGETMVGCLSLGGHNLGPGLHGCPWGVPHTAVVRTAFHNTPTACMRPLANACMAG